MHSFALGSESHLEGLCSLREGAAETGDYLPEQLQAVRGQMLCGDSQRWSQNVDAISRSNV